MEHLTTGKQLIVIGGGAAGFFCAVNSARLNPSLQVTILEKSNKLLSKVRVSGGGRCNVTHACFDIYDMVRKYPRGANFLKKAFHQFFTTDTIKWFEDRGVRLKTEPDGRMFPVSDSSQTIVDCLMQEARLNRVDVVMGAEVKEVRKHDEKFEIQLGSGVVMQCDFLCVACGGYGKISMFDWIGKLGHSIEEPVPSLFTFNIPKHPITQLMGISVADVGVKLAGSKLTERGPLLITHWGLSGPAILRLSAWGAKELAARNWEFGAIVNWLPEVNEQSVRESFYNSRKDMSSQKISGRNLWGLPQRLWQFLCAESAVYDDMRWGDLPTKIQNHLIRNILSYELSIRGKTTFKEEFVTAGGVQLNEIDANTMESKVIPCLYFAGEVMNIDGITGGFNFQHAWSSGWIAARAIASNP